MSLPHILSVECQNCRVTNYCPQKGNSPLKMPSGQRVLCRLIGGYGKKPVDPSILSEESKKLVDVQGPCLTIAEVPLLDEASGLVAYQVVKIFSPPIVHERETMNEAQVAAMKVRNQRS